MDNKTEFREDNSHPGGVAISRNEGFENSILIIDDDTWFHRVIGKYLQSWGLQFNSFLDPVDGLAYAITHRPMLIILDIIMPEVRGTTILRILKKIDFTSEIPVLIISGNMQVDTVVETFKDGASGFISKPLTKDTLYMKIKEFLEPQIQKKIEEYSPDLFHEE